MEATGGRAVLGKERRIEEEPCMPRVNDKVHAGRRRAHSNAPESFILECQIECVHGSEGLRLKVAVVPFKSRGAKRKFARCA